MSLKHKIDKIEDVAEPLRGYYEAGQDGKYYLQVDGLVPKAQLDEFRQNNIQLMQKIQTYETTYKDVDVAKYKEMLAANDKTPEQIEEAVRARTKQLVEEHTVTLSERDAKIQNLSQQLNSVLIDGALKAEAAKAGVLPTALDDVVLRGRMVYSLNEKGEYVAKDSKGNVLYDRDGTSILSMATWLKDLKKSAPHLFAGMNGGGAGGNTGGGVNGFDMSKASATQKISAGLAQLNGS